MSVQGRQRHRLCLVARPGGKLMAKWISPVAIIACEGARDEASAHALAAAFARGHWERVTRLYRAKALLTGASRPRVDDRCAVIRWLVRPEATLMVALANHQDGSNSG
jgi:hypothetical protein